MNADKISWDIAEFNLDTSPTIVTIIEPAYPYFYFPAQTVKNFVAECQRVSVCQPASIVTYTVDSIYFEQPCSEVDQ